MAILYLLIFILGLFFVWFFGRREHYDEEKLIDLVLVSTGAALLLSRAAFFITGVGRDSFLNIIGGSNIWVTLIRLFDLGNGAVLWVAIVGFLIIMVVLLRLWKWPLWPMAGIASIGIGGAFVFSMTVLTISQWSIGNMYWLVGSSLVVGLISYAYFFHGDEKLSVFIADFRRGYSENATKLREKRIHKKVVEETEEISEVPKEERLPINSTESVKKDNK